MRLTVGPLPPSVYWRRRALVLGVLVLIVLGIFYAVGGGPSGGAGPSSLSDTSSPSGTSVATVTPTPTAFTLPIATVTGPSATSATAAPTTIASQYCTDAEILLTATPSPSVLMIGQVAIFTLKIKNISNRTCTRNIGSRPQELQLRQGSMVVWSSDDCVDGEPYDHNQQFLPGFERSFAITWDGYRSRDETGQVIPCGQPGTSRPGGGSYQLVARLGTLFSAPAAVTIRSGS